VSKYSVVKAAAIGRLASKGLSVEAAEAAYKMYMGKVAQATMPGGGMQSGTTPSAPKYTPNVMAPPMTPGQPTATQGQPGDTVPNALSTTPVSPTQLAGARKANEGALKNPALAALGNQPGQIPTAMGTAADGLKMASDNQLMICKAACVMQLATYGIHPDIALTLFNNQLNKCGQELIKTLKG